MGQWQERGTVRPGENENSNRGGTTTPWEVREKKVWGQDLIEEELGQQSCTWGRIPGDRDEEKCGA